MAAAKKLNAHFNEQHKPRKGALEAAVKANDIAAVKDLLQRGASANEGDVLLTAVLKSGKEIVSALLDAGANINVRGSAQRTPLITALERATLNAYDRRGLEATEDTENPSYKKDKADGLEIARLLVDKRADVTLEANNGVYDTLSAIELVVREKGPAAKELVRLMLDKGANPNDTNHFGDTLLVMAIANQGDDPDIVRWLLDHGAQENKVTGLRQTSALISAVGAGAVKTVRLLLERGADVAVHDGNNRTALDVAKAHNNTELVQLLEEYAAKAKPVTPNKIAKIKKPHL